MRNLFRFLVLRPVLVTGAAVLLVFIAERPGFSAPPQAPPVPVVNAGLGPCSADFTVKDGENKPIYGATISVNFRYGFLNLHKESLEAYTNSDGKARFAGFPNYVKNDLAFRLHYHGRQKTVLDDPSVTCQAVEIVVLP